MRLIRLPGFSNIRKRIFSVTSGLRASCFSVLLCLSVLQAAAQSSDPDPVQLDKAVAYFNSGKYHEALLIFERLDRRYKLNNRFKAYIGLCHYKEWEYERATQYLDAVLPHLGVLAPHERSVYYFSNAESHFLLQEYKRAIPFYEEALLVCYDSEKGEIYYRIGLCRMFSEEWEKAYDAYSLAEKFFRKHRTAAGVEARLAQVVNMLKGCRAKIDAEKKSAMPATDDNVAKKKKEWENIAPINLDDLYKNKVEVSE